MSGFSVFVSYNKGKLERMGNSEIERKCTESTKQMKKPPVFVIILWPIARTYYSRE